MNRSNIAFFISCIMLFCSCSFVKNDGSTESAAEQFMAEDILEEQVLLEPEEESEPDSDYIPSRGGVIKIDCRNPKTFNPLLNEELSVDRLLRLIYEPLLTFDGNVKPSPGIASSWEFSPDGLSLLLRIRDGALWEDGVPITAEDVVYSLDFINNSPDTALYKKCMEKITGYSRPDEKTVRIDYEKPFSGALYNLTFPVIPKHHFSAGRNPGDIKEPLGSGMYKLEEYNIMRNVRLTASDSCYRGRPAIPEVEAIIVRDLESSLYAYDRGIIDIAETNLANWKSISTTRQSNIFMQASSNYEFLALNFRNSALQNINVRRAIAHSVPKTEIIDKLYAGNAFAADTPINPQSWLYEPDVTTYGFDPERAKICLSLAEDEFPDGITINIIVNNDNDERMLTAGLLRDALTEIGVSCRVESFPFDDYAYRVQAGYFDIAVCGLQMPLNPDLSPVFGNIGGVLGEKNFISYKDDVMDGYLAQAEMSVFEGPQAAAYSTVQKHFAEQLPYVSILYKANVVLTGKNVFGDVTPVINNAYNNIGELMIKH